MKTLSIYLVAILVGGTFNVSKSERMAISINETIADQNIKNVRLLKEPVYNDHQQDQDTWDLNTTEFDANQNYSMLLQANSKCRSRLL